MLGICGPPYSTVVEIGSVDTCWSLLLSAFPVLPFPAAEDADRAELGALCVPSPLIPLSGQTED